jgi:hypothetical protein
MWEVAVAGMQSLSFEGAGQGGVPTFPRMTVSGAVGFWTVLSGLTVMRETREVLGPVRVATLSS